MKLKKLTALFLSLALVFSILGNNITAKAEEIVFEDAKVTVADSIADFDAKAELSWSCSLSSTEDDQIVSAYASFTLEEDSFVIASLSKTTPTNVYAQPDFYIYSNKGMTNEKISARNIFDSDKKANFLPAGTYYIKVEDSKLMMWKHEFKLDVCIGAIPVSKMLSVNTKIDKVKNTAKITVNEGFGENLRNLQYLKGKVSDTYVNNEKYWTKKITGDYYTSGHASTVLKNNTFTVKNNGTYTIRMENNDGQAYSINFTVKGLDNTAPTVTGVKNGSTYKKPVTVKFNDSGTGVKKATLNGKTIKTNKKVSAKGKYTLTVIDKVGNKRTVKFTIK